MLCLFPKVCFNDPMNSALIIEKLGGPSEVAALCDCTPQAVSQWFGPDPETQIQRKIPKPRLMYLRLLKPAIFAELDKLGALEEEHSTDKAKAE